VLPQIKSACIVGKGPSYRNYLDVEADIFICLNHAIEKVRKGILFQRDHGPIFDVPNDVEIVGTKAVIDSYGRGYYYTWDQIPKMCSAFSALYLADKLGAEKIIMVGFDNLAGRSTTYHSDFPQSHEVKQWQWGLEQQIEQFQQLPEYLKAKAIIV